MSVPSSDGAAADTGSVVKVPMQEPAEIEEWKKYRCIYIYILQEFLGQHGHQSEFMKGTC